MSWEEKLPKPLCPKHTGLSKIQLLAVPREPPTERPIPASHAGETQGTATRQASLQGGAVHTAIITSGSVGLRTATAPPAAHQPAGREHPHLSQLQPQPGLLPLPSGHQLESTLTMN